MTHDNSDAGIGVSSASNGNTITGNESYANARGFSRAAAGIDLRNSTGNRSARNRLHDNEDSGLNVWTGSDRDSLAVNNVVWTNGDHGIDVHSTNDAIVVANTVYKNYDSGIEMTGSLRTYLANNISADNGINSARTSGQVRADATSAPSTSARQRPALPVGRRRAPRRSSSTGRGTKYTTLAAFRSATGKEAHGSRRTRSSSAAPPPTCTWRPVRRRSAAANGSATVSPRPTPTACRGRRRSTSGRYEFH